MKKVLDELEQELDQAQEKLDQAMVLAVLAWLCLMVGSIVGQMTDIPAMSVPGVVAMVVAVIHFVRVQLTVQRARKRFTLALDQFEAEIEARLREYRP